MNKIRMPQSLVPDVVRFVNLLMIHPMFNEGFIDAFSTLTLQSVLHICILTAPTSSCEVFGLYLHYQQ